MPSVLEQLEALGEKMTTDPYFSERQRILRDELLRNALPDLLAACNAARSLYLGLTCAFDPMDVDERIANLGMRLAPLLREVEE